VQDAHPVKVGAAGVIPVCDAQQNCNADPEKEAAAAVAAAGPARHAEQSLNNFQVLYLN
jgi:hypothetical protein